ncbi:hypothetical protein K8I85_11930, partial [bacterium]|nr:hypothetical protein [bacterium]
MCGQEESQSEQAGSETIRAIGDNRALIIFARFPDAEQVNAQGQSVDECANCGDGWAVGTASDSVPVWADSLLCPSNADSLEVPGSLTHYFYEMSGGQHFLTGDVLDTVITTDSTLAEYWEGSGGEFTRLQRANRDVLLAVDNLPSPWDVDFSTYDADADSIVDYVFIYWQSVRMYDESEPDSLRFKSFANGANAFSAILNPGDDLEFDDVTIKGGTSNTGSGATIWQTTAIPLGGGSAVDVRHRWQVATIMAHEYGHDLMSLVGFGGRHLKTASRYALMQGYSAPAAMLMSPLLRYKLWFDEDGSDPAEVIDFPSPGQFPLDTTVTLSTSYRDGSESIAVVRTADPEDDQYFVLEARTSNLPGETYNAVQPTDSGCCLPSIVVGDGLLISHVAEAGAAAWISTWAPIMAIETETGKFDTTTGAPDPIDGVDLITFDSYARGGPDSELGNGTGKYKDLYKHWISNTFGPYTNPNSNLYHEVNGKPAWSQDVYSGITIHDIKLLYNPGDGLADSIRFKVHIDDPTNPPVDADTLRIASTIWRGDVQLTGDVVVESGKHLWIADGCRVITAADSDRFDAGVDPARAEMAVNGAVHLQGTTNATSSRDTGFAHWFPGVSTIDSTISGELEDPSPGDWYGWRFTDVDSDLYGGGLTMKYARAAIADENPSAAWPDLAALDDSITFSDNVADVGFDRDHTVAADSVVFPPGISIGFAETDADSATNGGKSPDCELIVADGAKLLAVGSPGSEIRIGSTVPDDSLQGDEWYGARLQAVGVKETGYGFLACVEVDPDPCPPDLCSYCDAEKSEFKHVRISGATYGLAIEGNLAPELDNVTFDHITGNRDIYLDGRDVVIPVDFTWNLVAPTDVVARKVTSLPDTSDYKYGTEDREDLVVEGALITSSAVAGSTVTFRPDTVGTAGLADDWGGASLLPTGATRSIEDADFGYAQTPLFLYYQDSTIVLRDTEIHHFGDVGLWIKGDFGTGVTIGDGLKVHRGGGLDDEAGNVGVLLDEADKLTFAGNTVELADASNYLNVGSRALEVYFGKTNCMAQGGNQRTLSIDGNVFVGPIDSLSAPGSAEGSASGIYANWVCGGSYRDVEITANDITGFDRFGMEFYQSSDIQVGCNEIWNSWRAVEHRRDSEPTGAGVRFRENVFSVPANPEALIRTDNA